MMKERYDYLCMESEAGCDTFGFHPAALEGWLAKNCWPPLNQTIVKPANGDRLTNSDWS